MTNVEETQVFRCTACSKKIRYNHEAKLHPLLDCLICRSCYINYGSGDFSKMPDGVDENGDDNYCRWCCDGGDLYGCGRTDPLTQVRCHYNFCRECVTRNVKDDPILDDQNKEPIWICYACDKTKIAKLRQEAEAAMKVLVKRPGPASQPKDSTPKDAATKQPTALPATTQQSANNSIVDSTATLVNKQNIKAFDKQATPTPTSNDPGLPSATRQNTPGSEKQTTSTSTNQIQRSRKIVSSTSKSGESIQAQKQKESIQAQKQKESIQAQKQSESIQVQKQSESIQTQKQTLKKPPQMGTQDQPTKRVKMPQNAIVTKLQFYGKINERCSREMRAKFDMLLKLYEQPDLDKKPKIRLIIDNELNALEQVMQEYQKMLVDLKKISHQ